MKYKQIWKTAASCLVAALMFPSCSDDEGGGGDVQDDRYRTLMITLNSLGSPEMGTRAETVTPDEPDDFDEHFISRYWLLVLKQDAESKEFKVDRVIDSEVVLLIPRTRNISFPIIQTTIRRRSLA